MNTASGHNATVAGGYWNTASGEEAAVGGGNINHADGAVATIGGGFQNVAGGTLSTVPGGMLYALSQEQAVRMQALEAENAALRAQMGSLEDRLAALERGQGTQAAAPAAGGGRAGLLLLGLSVPAGLVWAARRRRSLGTRALLLRGVS